MICLALLDSAPRLAGDYGPWLLGWLVGWLLLWRMRPLPPLNPGALATGARPSVAVIVPARNEAAALPTLLRPLLAGTRPGDELVVVDDHSTDATSTVALRHGARALHPPPLPDGWLGKPHACWFGARNTRAEVLLFVDADVQPAPDLVDRIGAAVAAHPDRVVSVQPWHRTGSAVEQLSLFCNVTALMGVGRFSILGGHVTPRSAFGPVLALHRRVYERIGGHANPSVRTMHTEDIGLARAVGAAELHTGAPDIAFRMYPDGFGQLLRGWTRSLATGARSVRWWAAFGTVAWVWSLTAGWTVAWWLYLPSALQVWLLGRRAGSFSPLAALLYPIPLAVFLWVFVRSVFAVVFRRRVEWKQRAVAAR